VRAVVPVREQAHHRVVFGQVEFAVADGASVSSTPPSAGQRSQNSMVGRRLDMRHVRPRVIMQQVARPLGHASPAVTRQVYAHLLRGPAREGMQAAVALVRNDRRAHSVHTPDPHGEGEAVAEG